MTYYVALGDSMSIDLYPWLELETAGRIDAAGRADATGLFDTMGRAGSPMGSQPRTVGAASLFHHNHDELWPEFEGRDLASRQSGIRKLDACVDGATISHTTKFQLPRVPEAVRESATVVTLTAGGNDLLGGLADGVAGVEGAVRSAMAGYEALIAALDGSFPSATLLLTTVYDPTDGTGVLPGVSDQIGRLPMEILETFNDRVRSLAAGTGRAILADAHRHFMGHGLTAPPDEMWYWAPSPIEPGARGASEIRRLWLEALEQAAETVG